MFCGVFFSRPKNYEENKQKKWENLQLETKELITQTSTEGIRNALRACSKDDKKLVEETKKNNISKMEIKFFEKTREWIITVYKSEVLPCAAPDTIHKLKSFEELQKTISRILKGVDCLRKLYVYKLNDNTPLKLLPSDSKSRLLVNTLLIVVGNGDQLENILSQVEPVYLRTLMMKDEGNFKVYDMKQVILAESLSVNSLSSIREDQLLKLEGKRIAIENIPCSIKEYIKKVAVKKSKGARVQFFIGGSNAYNEVLEMCPSNSNKVLLATENKNLNFCLSPRINSGKYSVRGKFLSSYDKIEPFFLSWKCCWQKVTKLVFCYDPETKSYNFEVERENYNYHEYSFESFVQAQKALHTILSVTSFIRTFTVLFHPSEKPLVWPKRKKKLTVVHLEVHGNHSITNIRQLLERIDPCYVKSVRISSNEVDDDLFNFEHISHASIVEISGAVLHDDQLLRMKAQYFKSESNRNDSRIQNKSLTANALNQYIKYCLFDSSDKNHYFAINRLSKELNIDEIYRDCIILKRYDSRSGFRQTFTVAGSEYVMHSMFYSNKIFGVRQKRDNHSVWWAEKGIPWLIR